MSLLIINDQIVLHINFYVEFCFMTKKQTSDYIWMLQQFKTTYLKLKFSDSTMIVTDMKKNLIVAIINKFSTINHLFCIWHINNNVMANCKRSFDDQKKWKSFFAAWKSIVYAFFEIEFWQLWNQFMIIYNDSECVKYLITTYVNDHRRHFIKCYINKMLHFETTTIFRNEGDHAIFKRQLESSSEDLKTMIDDIVLLLNNEMHKYFIVFEKAKFRYFIKFRQNFFSRLIVHVIFYVVRRIATQYDLLIARFTIVSSCTNVWITITRLSCSHKIQKRLFQNEILQLENVHSHWKYAKTFICIDFN